jgi:hypothetical protein
MYCIVRCFLRICLSAPIVDLDRYFDELNSMEANLRIIDYLTDFVYPDVLKNDTELQEIFEFLKNKFFLFDNVYRHDL